MEMECCIGLSGWPWLAVDLEDPPFIHSWKEYGQSWVQNYHKGNQLFETDQVKFMQNWLMMDTNYQFFYLLLF